MCTTTTGAGVCFVEWPKIHSVKEAPSPECVSRARQWLAQELPLRFPLLHDAIDPAFVVYNAKSSRRITISGSLRGEAMQSISGFHHVFTFLEEDYCVSSNLDGTCCRSFATKVDTKNLIHALHQLTGTSCALWHHGKHENIPDATRNLLVRHLKERCAPRELERVEVLSCLQNPQKTTVDFRVRANDREFWLSINSSGTIVQDFSLT
jgi:hypothetical protein